MDIYLAHSIWTVMMFVLFIGIIVWAWSGKRKESFREAANLPLEDDELQIEQANLRQAKSEENNNG
jgi:cytochrome c oxidase cbb3-type subunit 4